MEGDELGDILAGLQVTQTDSLAVENAVLERARGVTEAGIDTDASGEAVSELVRRTRSEIADAKSGEGNLDRLRMKLQMLLSLKRSRSLDGPQADDPQGGSHVGTIMSVDDAVRLGMATPQEALSAAPAGATASPSLSGSAPAKRAASVPRGSRSTTRTTVRASRSPRAASSTPAGAGRSRAREARSHAVSGADDYEHDDDDDDDDGWQASVGGVIRDDTDEASYTRRVEEWLEAGAGGPDVDMGPPGGPPLWLPADPAEKLLPYQRTAIRWLWQLHRQGTGGIVADEMGLGKTAQTLCHVASLRHSGLASPGGAALGRRRRRAADAVPVASSMPRAAGEAEDEDESSLPRFRTREDVDAAAPSHPSLVVCPATLLAHWFREATMWYPPLRVMVVHESGLALAGAGMSPAAALREARLGRYDLVLLTYSGMRQHRELLSSRSAPWWYVLLDEGHAIRNPDTEVSEAARTLPSSHRLALTGSPVQNSLRELWSVMDFVCPGRLGDAKTFDTTFAAPIAAGGWASASPAAQAMAFERAVVLRDAVRPYLLRRQKRDVARQLPAKTERVVHCAMTPLQHRCYSSYLASDDVQAAASGKQMAFKPMSVLRAICNHPWLVAGGQMESGGAGAAADGTGAPTRRWGTRTAPLDPTLQRLVNSEPGLFADSPRWWDSGKVRTMLAYMTSWHRGGHRCLVFCQGVRMLGLVEEVCGVRGWRCMRMDGSTAVKKRQGMVDAFNSDPEVFAFVMTTRTGGVGLNLTGADRVLIVDPDWNPSTDAQARERAWRLGQTRPVEVFRFVTKGTIEERIHQRQVYKTHLQRRVLANPDQKAVFEMTGLKDMFSLDRDVRVLPEAPPAGLRRAVAAGAAASGAIRQAAPVPRDEADDEEMEEGEVQEANAGTIEPASSQQASVWGDDDPGLAAADGDGQKDAGSDDDEGAEAGGDALVSALLGAAARSAGAGDDAEARASAVARAAQDVDASFRSEARAAAKRAASGLEKAWKGRTRRRRKAAAVPAAAKARAVPGSPLGRTKRRRSSQAPALPPTRLLPYLPSSPREIQLPVRLHLPGRVVIAGLRATERAGAVRSLSAATGDAATTAKLARRHFAGDVAGVHSHDSADSISAPHSSFLLGRLRTLQAARVQGQEEAANVALASARSQRLEGRWRR